MLKEEVQHNNLTAVGSAGTEKALSPILRLDCGMIKFMK